MSRMRIWSAAILLLALGARTCLAEDAAPPKFYKLEFVVKEIDGGKVLNGRTYSVMVSSSGDHACSIRTGSKVPVPTTGPGVSSGQFTYLDVGVEIDCYRVKEAQNGLSLDIQADVSGALQEYTSPPNLPPVVRQNKWGSSVIVPLKKPTVVFSSDDVTGKRQMQLELTATPIT